MIFDLFRSFLPLENPLGFGATDYLEIALALLLLCLTFLRPLLMPAAGRFANRSAACMLALALLPIALRLILLPHHPVPIPDVYDEFGHLFVARTLGHLRLANPTHPMHRFFETLFILQEPTYSSIYPLGQGLMLAFGRLLFGLPWAGVVLASSAVAALSYWMLRAWVTPEWALLGGVLAVIEFGPLSAWTNSYWGGALAACAGCLVFGALPRLAEHGRWRDGVALGAGLAVHLLTRPYESIPLLLSVVLFFVSIRSVRLRPAIVACGFVIAAGAITLVQNRAVTRNWWMLPYQLSQYEYGVPASLTFQADPVPHRELTRQQRLAYESQRAFRNSATETPASYFQRLEYRVRYCRFFFLSPLYLALLAYLAAFRRPHWAWVVGTGLLFALVSNFYPLFQVHYIAALTSLFLLMSVEGLMKLSAWRFGPPVVALIVFFCAAHFIFWYTLHLFENNEISIAMRRYETWDNINHDNPARRILVNRELAQMPGQLLVFVRYAPQHIFQEEWVYNEPDIDAARIVWARDRGPAEDQQLLQYYPRRTVLLLEPDLQPPKLSPFVPEPVPEAAVPVQPAPKPKAQPQPAKPKLQFEEVK